MHCTAIVVCKHVDTHPAGFLASFEKIWSSQPLVRDMQGETLTVRLPHSFGRNDWVLVRHSVVNDSGYSYLIIAGALPSCFEGHYEFHCWIEKYEVMIAAGIMPSCGVFVYA